MTIDKNLDGTKLEIALEGRLDTMTAPQLEEEVKNNIEGIKELIFDLKNPQVFAYFFPHRRS